MIRKSLQNALARRSAAPLYNRAVRPVKYVAAALTVTPIVGALELASVGYAGVAAPLLLLDVVVVARLWGTGPGIVGSASVGIAMGAP